MTRASLSGDISQAFTLAFSLAFASVSFLAFSPLSFWYVFSFVSLGIALNFIRSLDDGMDGIARKKTREKEKS